ncbi:MAG: DUF998 domain-containing protein [Ornithinibacter sp.]
MRTDTLLLFGAATAVVFVIVVTVEGVRRPGYDALFHTGSELELGPGGWIQRANFLLVAAGFAAISIGVQRTLETTTGAALLTVAAAGLVLAAICAPDPVRGFPPGASSNTGRAVSLHAKLHDVSGPLLVFALFGACLVIAPRLAEPWTIYTLATAGVGLASTVWLIVAWRGNAPYTGLAQRIVLATYWLWITILSLHLVAH